MFGLKREKQSFKVVVPITGEILPIEEVKDEVFSKKILGDGFAVKPRDSAYKVVSPINGEIIMLPSSKHAFGIKSNLRKDIEILVHIGIDTVNLNGKGFVAKAKVGQKVNAGDTIIEFDPMIMYEEQLDMTIMVIFTKSFNFDGKKDEIHYHEFDEGTTIISTN